MLFNSFEYTLFLPLVFLLYWFVTNRNLKAQNILLLVASYVFYGWWDWRFLSLIVFSSIVDFCIGIQLGKRTKPLHRKLLLALSLSVNLGLLGFFKYYNFFIDSFVSAFSSLGMQMNVTSLNIILPVGISFYTFQTLSYSIDVYRKNLVPTKDVVSFFTFVSFFPQLVAGPIERATNLLPQFTSPRKFDRNDAEDGLRQILWGLFKKVVIADNCALLVNDIFANYETLSASTLVLGTIYFAFQIYCDFSGYSDIAIGTAKLFGIRLMRNFAYPYFARDIGEFWRRWHISLSTWFRDYLYIPLGGSRGSDWKKFRNVAAIFIVSGFWHGANWTFMVWGALHAVFYLPLMFLGKNRSNMDITAAGKWLPGLRELSQIIWTFIMVCFAWIFFRAENITHAFSYIQHLFDWSILEKPTLILGIFFIVPLIVLEWIQRDKLHVLAIENKSALFRRVTYCLFIFCIFYFAPEAQVDFIYFQF